MATTTSHDPSVASGVSSAHVYEAAVASWLLAARRGAGRPRASAAGASRQAGAARTGGSRPGAAGGSRPAAAGGSAPGDRRAARACGSRVHAQSRRAAAITV